MKRLTVVMVICLVCLGCKASRMRLKRIDQDIPSALVAEYNTDTSPYVDEGATLCLPLLMFGEEHVAKTEQGFQAYEMGSLGFGLLLAIQEEADFDPKGRLLRYDGEGSLLTGLLFSEREIQIREGEELNKAHAKSILWGAIGFTSASTGAKSLTVLWIPIPVARGDK